MNTEQVRSIVRSAFQKLHIEGWWKGTHALRRTAASKVFNSGTSLKLTADILGHCAIQSTTAYVKIDTDSLAFLAGDWPQGGASC
jgi:site-specific recombinase XerD